MPDFEGKKDIEQYNWWINQLKHNPPVDLGNKETESPWC